MHATCIKKIKQNSKNYYVLLLENGYQDIYDSVTIKSGIASGKLIVNNLKLISNNRLIMYNNNSKLRTVAYVDYDALKSVDSYGELRFIVNIKNINSLIKKSELIGFEVIEAGRNVYILNSHDNTFVITEMDKIGIEDCDELFKNKHFSSIDMANTDTSKVTNARFMFSSVKASKINVKSIDTSNIKCMENMFHNIKVKELDLSKFNTSNAIDMGGMFSKSVIENLNISNFNTSNVMDMSRMFSKATIQNLDLSNFDTSNAVSMREMFSQADLNEVNLSGFRCQKVKIATNILYSAHINKLNLGIISNDLGNEFFKDAIGVSGACINELIITEDTTGYKPDLNIKETEIGNIKNVRKYFRIVKTW